MQSSLRNAFHDDTISSWADIATTHKRLRTPPPRKQDSNLQTLTNWSRALNPYEFNHDYAHSQRGFTDECYLRMVLESIDVSLNIVDGSNVPLQTCSHNWESRGQLNNFITMAHPHSLARETIRITIEHAPLHGGDFHAPILLALCMGYCPTNHNKCKQEQQS